MYVGAPEVHHLLHDHLGGTQLADERLQWRRVNPPGEAILFDNWRVLHGRLAYTGHRHLCGCYVNREDFLSRRRTLAAT